MASLGTLLLGSSNSCYSSSRPCPKVLPAIRLGRSVHRAIGGHRFRVRIDAVAAPEKPSSKSEPFTAWGTATERIAKRTDLKTIMILGAGPIVIGQVRPSRPRP